jgi:N-acyl homoserine lactone hydrolase
VLFATGLHPDCQHDPAGRLGPRLAGLFRIGFQPGEEVSARLEAIDRDPARSTSSSTRIFISIMSAAMR